MTADSKAVALGAELHRHYYLHNFLTLCDTVEQQYSDLLSPDERGFLQLFRGLSQSAQCLYVRLISRQGPWFRLSKLSYPEIDGLGRAVQELTAAGALFQAQGLSVVELGSLFTVAELRGVYGEFLPKPKVAGKAALLLAVDELSLDEGRHVALLTEASAETIIAPYGVDVVALLQILFFGNRHQGLTDFVLSDLGLATYYPYTLSAEHRLFPRREALDEYLDCCESEDIFYQCLEADDEQGIEAIAELMALGQINFPVAQRRWQRVWNTVARELERRRQYKLARQLYERSDRHPSRERLARILEAQRDWRGVEAACDTILHAPWCEAEREAALKISARARRKLGGEPKAKIPDAFAELSLTLEPHYACVELDAAAFLQHNWHSVHFVENGLMNTLFGLAFWEQIFADLPGAFHNAYQGGPRDMYDGDFVSNREEAIAQRLQTLRGACLREELVGAYHRYRGYQCHWVDWRLVDEDLLSTALQLIPATHLLAVWQRQLFDPAENRSGFPDLIAFADPAVGKPGDYCMIEVKGPGDALQNNQKRWLHFFLEHHIPAKVAWVEWGDA